MRGRIRPEPIDKKFGGAEGAMYHTLTLRLELLEQAAWGFRFRLTALNESMAKLFLPLPEIIGIRFCDPTALREAEWYTNSLVSAAGGGFALQPGESRSFEWRVRPCSVERPETDDYSDWDYRRWCVGLVPGKYLVWYQWQVDVKFFDPDSHMRLPDLEFAARREGAIVWLGQALSNQPAAGDARLTNRRAGSCRVAGAGQPPGTVAPPGPKPRQTDKDADGRPGLGLGSC